MAFLLPAVKPARSRRPCRFAGVGWGRSARPTRHGFHPRLVTFKPFGLAKQLLHLRWGNEDVACNVSTGALIPFDYRSGTSPLNDRDEIETSERSKVCSIRHCNISATPAGVEPFAFSSCYKPETPMGLHSRSIFIGVKNSMPDVACNVSTEAPIFFSFRHSQLFIFSSSLFQTSV